MIVVDASVLVDATVGGGDNADMARERIARALQLNAPHLIDVEVVNAVRRLNAAGQVSDELAATAMRQLQELDITRYEHTLFLHRMWELRHNVSAYDAAYVAVAEAVDVPLLTKDARLAEAPGLRCIVDVIE